MPKYLDGAGLSRFWDNIKGSIGNASQEQVDAWLDEHPEATTTVQDGSITTEKLADGAVTDAKLAQTGGVLSAVSAITSNIDMISEEVLTSVSGTGTAAKTINYNAEIINASAAYYINTYYVTENTKLYVSGTAVTSGYLYIFVDDNDVLIARSERNTSGGLKSYSGVAAVVPQGATKIIVASNSSTSYTQAHVNAVSGRTVNGVAELTESIEFITTERHVTKTASPEDYTEHANRYMFTTGTESSESTQWRYVEFTIPANTSSITVSAMAGQSSRLWILKDSNGNVLGYSSDSSSVSVKTETINLASYSGAAKLYVNDRKSTSLAIRYDVNLMVVDAKSVYEGNESLVTVISSLQDSNPLYGKVLCCAGDSITYGADMDAEGIASESDVTVYQSDASGTFSEVTTNFLKTWGWQIAHRNKMTFYNAGVSGSTMQGLVDKNGFSLANGRYTKLPDAIDYLIIWFGWNDTAYGTLGAITDTTNESFYGGYNVVLPYLINKYPYAKIAIVVPYGTDASHREAVRLLGNKWGVAVWDNYQGGTPLYYGKEDSVGVEQSVVTANRAKFQAVGAHPNHHGHKQLADMIEHWMQSL